MSPRDVLRTTLLQINDSPDLGQPSNDTSHDQGNSESEADTGNNMTTDIHCAPSTRLEPGPDLNENEA